MNAIIDSLEVESKKVIEQKILLKYLTLFCLFSIFFILILQIHRRFFIRVCSIDTSCLLASRVIGYKFSFESFTSSAYQKEPLFAPMNENSIKIPFKKFIGFIKYYRLGTKNSPFEYEELRYVLKKIDIQKLDYLIEKTGGLIWIQDQRFSYIYPNSDKLQIRIKKSTNRKLKGFDQYSIYVHSFF